MRRPIALVLTIAMASSAAMAEQVVKKTGTGYQYSDSTDTLNQQAAMTLTPEERTMAKEWMLQESDWVKFKQIMKGPRGTWSPNLDPLTALGVHETDPNERMRYAEIWMKVEAKRKEGELAFERARMIAAKKIFGDMKTIENDQWIADWNRENVAVNKSIAYFVDSTCLDECKDHFQSVSDSITTRTRFDIYFVAGATAEDITKWAQFMEISPEVVNTRKVTLNYDKGTAARMGINLDALPQVREVPVN